MALQSSQRLPELLFYTKKSYRILQAPIPAPILHVHITLQSRELSIQNPILHAEDKELFEYYYYIQRAKDLHSRNSTHRRQGDLLEIHPCVLQDIPGSSSCSRDIPDIPVIHDLPAFPGNSTNSTMFQYLQGIHPIPSILQLECIFYSSIGFHRKLHRVPVGQLQYEHSFFKEREMLRYRSNWQILHNRIISFIVLSSDNTNCKNDIQLFLQLFDELCVHRDYH